ncbi:hypothetical protein HMPREF7215_2418 [Pyramidobacter piscolens W5455]|uniref:Uncharacterized protein n=1 Tax=Pyramidobacter piscolens W5455 TaxID=352165 RepID=A0ABM9ZS04_9BACT|nr:hypothetical protein HMPREF7215_2418 [Pyramidobacter piscolens W5455]
MLNSLRLLLSSDICGIPPQNGKFFAARRPLGSSDAAPVQP